MRQRPPVLPLDTELRLDGRRRSRDQLRGVVVVVMTEQSAAGDVQYLDLACRGSNRTHEFPLVITDMRGSGLEKLKVRLAFTLRTTTTCWLAML